MKINLTTFFSGLGVTSGNTQATNFYDFWKGIIMNGETEINDITDFMTYLGTTRYEFFHSLQSTYPDVWDEYTFYQNIDDPRIYDFKTFYTYAGEYLGGSPSPTSFEWYYYDGFATGECGTIYLGLPIFYTNTEFPLPGDIIYSDSGLTTTFVGGGVNVFYQWGLPIEVDCRGVWEIAPDGTILSNNTNCLGTYTSSSGLTSPDCNTTSSQYLYSSFNPVVNSSRFFVVNADNNIIGYLNGENKYYTLFDGVLESFKIYRINTNGLLIEEIICPPPTPTPTPTNTPTPTPTPTNTPTPSPSPTIQATYITETRSTTNALSYTFTSQSYGGPGYIVVAIASTSTIQQAPAITSVSIAGKAATNLYSAPQTATLAPGFWAVRITGGTSGDIVVNYSVAQLGCSIAIYRIQNNISDTYNQRTFANLNSGAGTTLTKTFASNVNSNDIVLALAITDNAASTETWTRPTENAARVNETIRSSYASEKQTTTGSYTATVEFSAEPTTRASLTMITIR